MKNGQLISIFIIIFGVITGFVIYYYTSNSEERIYVESFDRTVEFELGVYNVSNLNKNITVFTNITSIQVDNKEDFIEQVVTSNESYVGTLNYTISDFDTEIYYFVENSYCYFLRSYGENEFVLQTCSYQLLSNDFAAEIPFIPFTYVEYDLKYMYTDMNSSSFLTFQDYIDFFELIGNDNIQIDTVQAKIYLTPFDLWETVYDPNYQVVLTFDTEGFTITLE